MQEGLQLINDDPADVNVSNTRLEFIWEIGRADLFNGMNKADEVGKALRCRKIQDSLCIPTH